MKVAVITCYKQPDYVRARTLRRAVEATPGDELLVVKNSRKGLLRYPEVLLKTIWLRLRHRPDAYIITFRGFEVLPAINLLTWPKPLIFDELINPLEWLLEPRPEKWVRFVPYKLLRAFYRLLLRRPRVILADTKEHAAYSAEITYGKKMPQKYVSLPVSTEEELFKPEAKRSLPGKIFKVFYYGNMIPLHGLTYVFEAAVILKDAPIEFTIIGGKAAAETAATEAIKAGAHINYATWINYTEIPAAAHRADLCLGGPFGATVQARQVITGKTYQFMASGAPTLIGKSDSSNGIFTDKKDCLIVPLGDSKALAKAIVWASQHPKELAAIGKNGRVLYEKAFSVAVIAPQLESILHM